MVAASPLMLTQTCVVDSVKPTDAYTQMTICTEIRPDRACHISGPISCLHAKDMCTNMYKCVLTLFLRASRESNSSLASLTWICLGTSGITNARMNLKARRTCCNKQKKTTLLQFSWTVIM